jgi:hypothetical protein
MCYHVFVALVGRRRGTGGPAHTLKNYAYALGALLVILVALGFISWLLENYRQRHAVTTSLSQKVTAIPLLLAIIVALVAFVECIAMGRGVLALMQMARYSHVEGGDALVGSNTTQEDEELIMERELLKSPLANMLPQPDEENVSTDCQDGHAGE